MHACCALKHTQRYIRARPHTRTRTQLRLRNSGNLLPCCQKGSAHSLCTSKPTSYLLPASRVPGRAAHEVGVSSRQRTGKGPWHRKGSDDVGAPSGSKQRAPASRRLSWLGGRSHTSHTRLVQRTTGSVSRRTIIIAIIITVDYDHRVTIKSSRYNHRVIITDPSSHGAQAAAACCCTIINVLVMIIMSTQSISGRRASTAHAAVNILCGQDQTTVIHYYPTQHNHQHAPCMAAVDGHGQPRRGRRCRRCLHPSLQIKPACTSPYL